MAELELLCISLRGDYSDIWNTSKKHLVLMIGIHKTCQMRMDEIIYRLIPFFGVKQAFSTTSIGYDVI